MNQKNNGKIKICIYVLQLSILSAGWWGMLYPNLSMTEDTFRTVEEEKAGYMSAEKTDGYFGMLYAGPGEIKVKSRLLEKLLGIEEDENGK